MKIRSVQYWMFSIYHSTDVPVEFDHCMDYLQKSLQHIQWQPFAELLKQVPQVQQTDR